MGPDREALRKAIRKYSYRENFEELFTLSSGKKSPYYLDLKQTLMQPKYLWQTAKLFFQKLEKLPEKFIAAAGLTMGADPLTYALCLYAWQKKKNLYPLVVRKEVKGHGTKKLVEGYLDFTEGSVVLLEDVVTTAASALKAYYEIKKLNLQVSYCLCVVDREEGGRENLLKEGITLYSLFTLSELKNL